jgi:hypothetical protein
MAVSKLNAADAQEWLESLQQVGEGWWRQVALAVRANAHKTLGMERREFVQTIGQRLVDPREAIIELFNEGTKPQVIADILGVSADRTVRRILAEEGLIEWSPTVARKALEQGHDAPADVAAASPESDSDVDAAPEKLQAQIEDLQTQIKGEQAKRKREVKEVNDKLKDLRKAIREEKARAREEAEKALTEQERERARKEADAWAEEQGQKILAGFAGLAVDHIVSALQEAADDMRMLINQNAVTQQSIEKIEAAHAGFQEELNVARMAASV